MEFEVFKSGEVIATLTPESCRSHCGIPVLRIEGEISKRPEGNDYMTPWMEAIDKLRFLGYSVTLEEGKSRYAYQEEGNPPQDEIIPLLDTLKAPKGETGIFF